MEISDQILEEIRRIKSQCGVDVSGSYYRWPSSLRQLAETLLRSGVSPKELSKATGIAARTLYDWRRAFKVKGFQEISVMPAEPKIATEPNKVSSTLKRSVKKYKTHDPMTKHLLTVKTPDGFSVSVGSCAEAVEFVVGCRKAGLCS